MFFYKKIVKEKDKPDVIVYDCLNPEYVIRGVSHQGKLILLMDDGHEESRYILPPRFNKDHKMIDEGKKSREYVISEIELDEEDAARFHNIYSHNKQA
jgi:hypothetical protein